ncbi:MAG: filamentous hemagglutinin N-terminal domain-containing protein [Cyanobacteria bacterium P01_G01_bin.54]
MHRSALLQAVLTPTLFFTRAITPTLLLGMLLGTGGAQAQTVNADGTVGTTVTGAGPFTITGGTIQGNNLFHSFTDFSPATAATTFDLTDGSYGGTASGVTAIINRVTGSNVSNLDGLLQVLGGADPDFFLINPNGIVFGTNAQLDLNGSFIGSTAHSLVFPDGITFAASDTTVAPLLTVNRPIGLQMGSSPGNIQVNGAGHALSRAVFLLPTDRSTPAASFLQVDTGQTLALVGGEVTLDGGVLMAEAGNIELGAVQNATVNLSQTHAGWTLDTAQGQNFGDIRLTQQALLDVSSDAGGSASGSVSLHGANIALTDVSTILSQNFSNQPGGLVQVQATETLQMQGTTTTPGNNLRTGIVTEAFGTGTGGDIALTARQLAMSEGAEVQPRTFGLANSGALTVQVSETATLTSGLFATDQLTFRQTSLSTSTVDLLGFGTGDAGIVQLAAGTLNILDGATVGSSTLSNALLANTTSAAGDVNVTVDTLNISGVNPLLTTSGGLGSVTFGSGAAAELTVNAREIHLSDGGRITTTLTAEGNAGNLNINASERILVQGNPDAGDETGFFASGDIFPADVRLLLGLPDQPTGQSGNVNINTPYLAVNQGGTITARNDGTGDSGGVTLTGDIVYLDDGGTITASTLSGEGGNINLDLQELLLLRRGSLISTEAGGSGNGGNITIAAPVIAGYENSDIVANAFQGNGGNITITTQGIFGLAFREQLTAENDITASSQFGLNGTFTVNEFSLDPSSGLVALTVALSDASNQVNATCSASRQSEFVATGRGGVPPAPGAQSGDRPWQDTRDLSAFLGHTPASPAISPQPTPPQPQEATGFQTLANGEVLLVAQAVATAAGAPYATCAVHSGT